METDSNSDQTVRWMDRSSNILNELRKAEKLCDAFIQVDGGEQFPVHRAVMSACSPYFRALFTNGLFILFFIYLFFQENYTKYKFRTFKTHKVLVNFPDHVLG